MAPACRTRDSQTVFSVAREAVWEETARAPSAVWPPFQMTTGFALADVLENFEESGGRP